MIVNVKGVGKIDFPDGMSLSTIKELLSKPKDKPIDENAIVAIVKRIIEEEERKEEKSEMEDSEPSVVVNTEPPDMRPIAEALLTVLDKPDIPLKLESSGGTRVSDVEIIERDIAGHIKRIRMTEILDNN